MRTHYHPLAQGSLLTLCAEPDANAALLTDALRHALHSNPPSVWVDCGHVAVLPAGVLRLLRRCANRLWQQGGHLIVCRLPPASRAQLAAQAGAPLAASLLDAELYGLPCPPAPTPAAGGFPGK